MSQEFDDIRPYNDDEVPAVLARLQQDNEFIDSLSKLKFPRLPRILAPLMRPFIRGAITKEIEGVATVRGFQDKIESYLGKIIDDTITELSISGLDNLQRDTAHLFISNHRDITMDPALVNWVLYQNGFTTLRIAIGDNLLTKPSASHLMRLNKSFIVNRSATKPREKLKAAKLLSKYIHYSVSEDNENIWIAQREGRAKDGDDQTNPAIISMLALNRPKSQDFGEFIRQARIVPVSISYEYDPCDQDKARELVAKEETGHYAKAEHEDVQSIVKGITGEKGRVHLAFGKPLDGDFENTDSVTAELDNTICDNYVLHATNCFAYEHLEKKSPRVPFGEKSSMFDEANVDAERDKFLAHIEGCEPKYRETMLNGYGKPLYKKLASEK